MGFVADEEQPASTGRFIPDERRAAPKSENGTTPFGAGLMNFGAGIAGLPGAALKGLLNIPGMIAGTAATAAGRPDLAPGIVNVPGQPEEFAGMLRRTGVPSLSPDNPNPNDKLATAAYDLTSRGGFIPGGLVPAVGSMIAEKIGGPQWAGVGAMAPAAMAQAGRAGISAVASKSSPQAELLKAEGVSLTPGQMMGGSVKRIEDAATSVPILGDAIKAAQIRGVKSFDAAAINRSLAPIGETLPKGIYGNKAIEYAYGKLGDAYDSLLPNLKGDLNYKAPANALPSKIGQAAPASLREELSTIKDMGQQLPQPMRGQLGRIIEKEVLKRFTPQGMASGETLKEIESQLGQLSKGFGRSENYDVRTLGGAVKEIQNSLRRMVERVNPEYAGELAKVNEGYSNFKITQRAAGNVGAPDGVFTPAQLHRSVKASDISKDKARFAEGNANMQDLSGAGKAVLPSSVPDSGTPFRAAAMYAMTHPLRAGLMGVPIAAATLPYTPMGQGALQSILSQRSAKPQGSLQNLLQAIAASQGQPQQ